MGNCFPLEDGYVVDLMAEAIRLYDLRVEREYMERVTAECDDRWDDRWPEAYDLQGNGR